MRRLIIGCSAAAVLLVGGLAVSTAVQATTPPTEEPAEGHPFVGAWIYTVDGFPEAFTVLLAIDADGTWIDTSPDGSTSIGSWEATGPNSFSLTFHSLSLTEDGSVAFLTIRSTGEVSEDGQSWTAEYTAELTGEGLPPGEHGPGSATGTRINVEPMGAPVGPVEALFPDLFPPEGGTAPAGTAPAGTEPVGTAPIGTEPAGTEPAATEPAGTTPVDTAAATTTG
jgi:hypothetical protein